MSETSTWWIFLCVVSALNISAWLVSAVSLRRLRPSLEPAAWSATRIQLLLSAAYVLGCAYRSALPVYDVQRLCLVDSWMSSVIVGRTVATIAELCFAAQWALLMRTAARNAGHSFGLLVASSVVPLIAIAEIFSWHAVLTTSNLGHVVEESIWGLCAAMLVLSLIFLLPRTERRLRPLFGLCCVVGVAYVFFMFLVDVPMYWARWVADEAAGRSYMGIGQGLVDASTRWVVSHSWQDWKSEVVWMSLYFSVAVWLSIGLAHAPVLSRTATAATMDSRHAVCRLHKEKP